MRKFAYNYFRVGTASVDFSVTIKTHSSLQM